MPFDPDYTTDEPSRSEIDAQPGATVLEFGSPWCGYCRRAAPLVAEAFSDHDGIRHIKIADSSGRPLGRSFGIKLWPTLIFLKDGREIGRLVRPTDGGEIKNAMQALDSPAGIRDAGPT
ncbi:thioredoxin family protein [Pseudorhodoplanes sp.]|uniref:thioredoxin family protein n=1 Tax=Pseudorhodoplanes sp. TaxID=1934341 RepID=UPI002C3D114B|nr:thioredoxin family protein [Pseudorhodoplanes sp.]HWV55659.1 thioredoxin family protein [Pseudorhodoplanes sp.]